MAKFRVQLRRTIAESVFFEIDAGSDQKVRDLLRNQVMIEDLPRRRAPDRTDLIER